MKLLKTSEVHKSLGIYYSSPNPKLSDVDGVSP